MLKYTEKGRFEHVKSDPIKARQAINDSKAYMAGVENKVSPYKPIAKIIIKGTTLRDGGELTKGVYDVSLPLLPNDNKTYGLFVQSFYTEGSPSGIYAIHVKELYQPNSYCTDGSSDILLVNKGDVYENNSPYPDVVLGDSFNFTNLKTLTIEIQAYGADYTQLNENEWYMTLLIVEI